MANEATITVLPVIDQTINNVAEYKTAYRIASAKRWGAIVWGDRSKPGGLDRKFLKSRESGRIILVHEVNEGDFIELAHKIEAYSQRGTGRDCRYFRVLERLPDKLVVLEVDATDVPRKDEKQALSAESKSSIGIAEIERLVAEIEGLRKRVGSLQSQLAAVKNVHNRISRKHKEGKLTQESLGEELLRMRASLKDPAAAPDTEAGDREEREKQIAGAHDLAATAERVGPNTNGGAEK